MINDQSKDNINKSNKGLAQGMNNNDIFGSDEFEGTGNFSDTKKQKGSSNKVFEGDNFESSKNKQSKEGLKDSFEADPFEETDKNEEDAF